MNLSLVTDNFKILVYKGIPFREEIIHILLACSLTYTEESGR